MFEVSWSELLILGIVTLLLVGPKELPRFLSSLGRHLGVIRRHANEFKAVFEQAMREAEMDSIQKEMRDVGEGVKKSFDDVTRSIDSTKAAMKVDPDAPGAVKPAPEGSPQIESSTETADTAPQALATPDDAAPSPAESDGKKPAETGEGSR